MDYEIIPYVSVNGISFYTKQKYVENKYGKAYEIVIDNIMNNIIEKRQGAEFTYEDEELVAVTFYESVNVLYKDMDLMHNVYALDKLKALSSNFTKQKDGSILFIDLGLIFSNPDKKDKLIIAFSQKMLDEYMYYGNV